MKNLVLLFAATFFLLFGCHKIDEPVVEPTSKDITVSVKATFDGQVLEKDKVLELANGQTLDFNTFTLYLSDISLLKNGQETLLSEIEYFNFFSNPTSPLAQTKTFTAKSIKSDTYDGLKIGFGVKPTLNKLKPSNFPAGHPLANEIEFWLGWKSYIFSKIEIEANLDASPDMETFLSYHAGSTTSNDVYRVGSMTVPIDLTTAKNSFTIEIDLKKLFWINGKLLDLTDPENQATGGTPSDLGLAAKLLENFINTVSVKP